MLFIFIKNWNRWKKSFFIVIAKLLMSCGNFNANGFGITASFCFRKIPRDDIENLSVFQQFQITG